MKAIKNNSKSVDDSEILSLSLQSPSVFAQIVDRYQEPFVKKALTIIGNEEDAQDIVQEAFTKIYLNAHKFERRAGATFNSWAYKILLNTCFSHYKKHKKEARNLSYDDSIELVSVEDVKEESKMEKFLLTLSIIPESAARLLKFIVVEGKSHKDISEIEGISEEAVRVRIHRAKETFKKALIQNSNL